MNRREFLGSTAATSLMLFSGPSFAGKKKRARPAKPNVVLIICDDLNTEAKGEHIRWLEARSRNYINAHCAAPACVPSRAAMLFGMQPWESGCYTLDERWFLNNRLPASSALPSRMREKGYNIFGTGKIFHGHENDVEWDIYNPADNVINGDENMCGINYGDNATIGNMPDVKISNWAVNRVLSREHTKPFFLTVGLQKPHTPLAVPPRFFDEPVHALAGLKYNDQADLGPYAKKVASQIDIDACMTNPTPVIHAYQAAVREADYCIGLLLDGLLAGPNKNDTLVILTSDHGFQLGEKEAWHKFSLWEKSTKVPFMMYASWLDPMTNRQPTSLTDLYHMLVDGDHVMPARPAVVTSWMLEGETTPSFTVRDQNYRYIRYKNGIEEELYYNTNDPHEWNNIAAAAPAKCAAMRAHVPTSWVARRGSI